MDLGLDVIARAELVELIQGGLVEELLQEFRGIVPTTLRTNILS